MSALVVTVTYTVDVSSTTKLVGINGSAASLSNVKPGTVIVAQGLFSPDGSTMAAQQVLIVPSGRRFYGGYGFGRGEFGGRAGRGYGQSGSGQPAQPGPAPSSPGATV
jgi:hypothetical protein